jgi:hypothetical protein
VYDNALVYGNAQVSANAMVYGNALVSANAQVKKTPFRVSRTDGYDFIYVPCRDGKMRVIAGCRHFTMEQAREHWTKTRGDTPLGEETMKILDYLESVSEIL